MIVSLFTGHLWTGEKPAKKGLQSGWEMALLGTPAECGVETRSGVRCGDDVVSTRVFLMITEWLLMRCGAEAEAGVALRYSIRGITSGK